MRGSGGRGGVFCYNLCYEVGSCFTLTIVVFRKKAAYLSCLRITFYCSHMYNVHMGDTSYVSNVHQE